MESNMPLPMNKSMLFNRSNAEKFNAICQQIESDRNYKPTITDEELLKLVCDGDDIKKVKAAEDLVKAYAITKPSFTTTLGRLYQFKETTLELDANRNYINAVDSRHVVLVKNDGSVFLHAFDKAVRGEFDEPYANFNLEDFLNKACLHPTVVTNVLSYKTSPSSIL
jgi:hypothetical protein